MIKFAVMITISAFLSSLNTKKPLSLKRENGFFKLSTRYLF